MKLHNDNIKIWQSMDYKGWYSVKKHLVNRFPMGRWFVVPSTLKGIGKSYSTWNEIIVPDINNLGLGTVFIRWTKAELNATIENLKSNAHELTDKLNCSIKWEKMDGVTFLSDSETGKPLIYFVIPSQFKVLKGITIDGNLPIKNVFWEEFLLPQGIYTKPQETLDSFWQLLGSIFRDNDFYIFMCANNTNPNNPFLWYVFNNMGWPNYGETVVDYDTGIVIDSPKFNDFVSKKYAKSTLMKLSKVNENVHKQLFGLGKLNDSIYDNQDRIMYRIDKDVNFQFKFRISTITYSVYTFLNDNQEWNVYITDQKNIIPVRFAGDLVTSLETKLPLIADDKILSIRGYLDAKLVWFRDVRTQNIIIDWVLRYRDLTRPIDWTKGKEKGGV